MSSLDSQDGTYFFMLTTKYSSNSILADNSLAEFEELENQLAGSQGSLKEIDYDAILAEIDQDLDDGIGRKGFEISIEYTVMIEK